MALRMYQPVALDRRNNQENQAETQRDVRPEAVPMRLSTEQIEMIRRSVRRNRKVYESLANR